jgi:hypothetical protein
LFSMQAYQFLSSVGQLDWSSHINFSGDVNGDGLDDLIWILPGKTPRVIVAKAKVL